MNLATSDVDLDAGTVRVSYTLQRVNGKLILVEPKSPSSRRRVALGAVAAQTLRDHRARQVKDQLRPR